MDEFEADAVKFNCITCATWVPRGAAKCNPERIEYTKEEIKEIVSKTEEELKMLTVEDMETDVMPTAESQSTTADCSDCGQEQEDIMKKYCLDVEELPMLQLGIKAHIEIPNVEEDPYIEKYSDSEEEEDAKILPTDNMLIVGRMEGCTSIIEAYAYNSEQEDLYVHHDFYLSSVPLCCEWLNYNGKDAPSGNFLAIGGMSPIVEVWDVDLLDCMDPVFKLGGGASKKRKVAGIGHKSAVLALSWNSYLDHLLASGSEDQTVIVWDLDTRNVGAHIKDFSGKVQALQWNAAEYHCLLTGSCDKKVRVFDCRAEKCQCTWKLDGEVENVTWKKLNSHPYHFLASTDKGTVYFMDARVQKPLWSENAHKVTCTGLSFSSSCPGFLVTASEDETVKIWDVQDTKPELVDTINPRLGIIYTVAACPDEPFVFAFGGAQDEENSFVLDLRNSKKVRAAFCERLGLPTDPEGEDLFNNESNKASRDGHGRDTPETSLATARSVSSVPKRKQEKKIFTKKKGGHLDKKKKHPK